MWEEAQFLTKPLVNTKKKFGYVYLKDVYTRTQISRSGVREHVSVQNC